MSLVPTNIQESFTHTGNYSPPEIPTIVGDLTVSQDLDIGGIAQSKK